MVGKNRGHIHVVYTTQPEACFTMLQQVSKLCTLSCVHILSLHAILERERNFTSFPAT